MTKKQPQPISIYPGPWLAIVDARATGIRSRSGAVSAICDRYASICERDLPRDLPGGQRAINLIRDSLSGCWPSDRVHPGAIQAEVGDHIDLNDAGDKWGLSPDECHALVMALGELTQGQVVALVDAIERWWSDPSASQETPLGGPFASVGK